MIRIRQLPGCNSKTFCSPQNVWPTFWGPGDRATRHPATFHLLGITYKGCKKVCDSHLDICVDTHRFARCLTINTVYQKFKDQKCMNIFLLLLWALKEIISKFKEIIVKYYLGRLLFRSQNASTLLILHEPTSPSFDLCLPSIRLLLWPRAAFLYRLISAEWLFGSRLFNVPCHVRYLCITGFHLHVSVVGKSLASDIATFSYRDGMRASPYAK